MIEAVFPGTVIASLQHNANLSKEGAHMMRFKDYCQHLFNPLHLFCRLRQVGMKSVAARNLCKVYEKAFYRFIL